MSAYRRRLHKDKVHWQSWFLFTVILCLCRKNSTESQNDSKVPQNNLAEFRQKFQDSLKLKNSLKSGFLYSLPEQNSNAAGGPGNIQRLTFFPSLLQGDACLLNLL